MSHIPSMQNKAVSKKKQVQLIDALLARMNHLEKVIFEMHQYLSFHMKRTEMLWGCACVKQMFTEEEIEEGYKIFKRHVETLTMLSDPKKMSLPDRINSLLDWNNKYKKWFYISPIHTSILKDLETYEGADKAELEAKLKEYYGEDNAPMDLKAVSETDGKIRDMEEHKADGAEPQPESGT